MGDIITGTAFLLAFMNFYVLFEAIRINRLLNSIDIMKLSVIPIVLGIFYLWIAIANPNIEMARCWSRFSMFTSLSIALNTVYSYSRKLRAKGRKQ